MRAICTILLNHLYLEFVGANMVVYQNFAGFLRHNFMGNLSVELQCKTIHYFVGTDICG